MAAATAASTRGWTALAAVMCVGLMGVGCDDGHSAATDGVPALMISPEVVSFHSVEPGRIDEGEVRFENVGDLPIELTDISVSFPAPQTLRVSVIQPDGTQRLNFDDGLKRALDSPVILDAGEVARVVVRYKPEADLTAEGALTIETSASESPVIIPIMVFAGEPSLRISATELEFGEVSVGETETRLVSLSNEGEQALQLEWAELVGTRDLSMTSEREDAAWSGKEEIWLAPGESTTIEIQYAPQTAGRVEARLRFSSNSPEPTPVIRITGRGVRRCLSVEPVGLDFVGTPIHQTHVRSVTLTSCGGRPVTIHRAWFSQDSDAAFKLLSDDEATLPSELPGRIEGVEPPGQLIRVLFSPARPQVHEATLIIETDDTDQPIREIPVIGRGVDNACPLANVAVEQIFVTPLTTVTLDGSPSSDEDGRINEWQWTLVDAPADVGNLIGEGLAGDGSILEMDDPTTPFARMWIPLPGTYEVELNVVDNVGLEARGCDNTARMTIVASVQEDIRVDLTWITDRDPDEADRQGSDLDLHFAHPLSEGWFSAPWDCHFNNSKPDWGRQDDPADDPVLSVDDTSGGGPESVRLHLPESTERLGAPYTVGVHYFRSQDALTGFEFGPARARVRIFIAGELRWAFGNRARTLAEQGAFWEAAEIHWPEGRVETVDRYFLSR